MHSRIQESSAKMKQILNEGKTCHHHIAGRHAGEFLHSDVSVSTACV